jgi:hypothetical protein
VLEIERDAAQAQRERAPIVGQRLGQERARSSGAAMRAASSASAANDESSGRTSAPAHSAFASSAIAAPVSRSRPGVGLISMFNITSLARHHAAAAASVGRGSPAKAAECHAARVELDSARQSSASARPRPLVVRSSVASCSRNATPSAESFASHSIMR